MASARSPLPSPRVPVSDARIPMPSACIPMSDARSAIRAVDSRLRMFARRSGCSWRRVVSLIRIPDARIPFPDARILMPDARAPTSDARSAMPGDRWAPASRPDTEWCSLVR